MYQFATSIVFIVNILKLSYFLLLLNVELHT